MNLSIIDAIDDRKLHLIILPTEKCNFRCTYCYEDFEKGIMSDRVSNSILKLLDNRASSLQRIDLSWFGGEPLLAKHVIDKISKHTLDLVKNFNLSYSANMTTNGYLLTPKVLQWAISLGINDFQVTIDGDENTHNLTRLRADKTGTFSTIWKNLISAKNSNLNFNILIRIHFSPKTINSLKIFINILQAELLTDKRFSIHFHAINRLGGKLDDKIDLFTSREEKEVATKELYNLLAKDTQVCKPDSEYVCYASKLNSFIIRSDGGLSKCTVAFHDDQNNIGTLREDGSFSLDMDKVRQWAKPLFQGDKKGASCPNSVIHLPSYNPVKISTVNI